jgi:hypothetical protein
MISLPTTCPRRCSALICSDRKTRLGPRRSDTGSIRRESTSVASCRASECLGQDLPPFSPAVLHEQNRHPFISGPPGPLPLGALAQACLVVSATVLTANQA